MRHYEMVEPHSKKDSTPVFCILSEEEIVNSTYGDYCCLMYLTRLNYLPTKEQIVEDWCIVHWATEIGGTDNV